MVANGDDERKVLGPRDRRVPPVGELEGPLWVNVRWGDRLGFDRDDAGGWQGSEL